MKIKQILVAFLFTALVISCGNKAKDIDVKELETECDVVDALEIVMDEMLELGEDVDPEEGVLGAIVYGFEGSKEQKKEYESLTEIADDIEKRMRKLEFDRDDLEDCTNYEIVDKKAKKVQKISRILE